MEFANPKPAFFPSHNPEKLKHKHQVFDGHIRESGLYICDFSSKHCIGSDIIQQVVRPCRTLSTGLGGKLGRTAVRCCDQLPWKNCTGTLTDLTSSTATISLSGCRLSLGGISYLACGPLSILHICRLLSHNRKRLLDGVAAQQLEKSRVRRFQIQCFDQRTRMCIHGCSPWPWNTSFTWIEDSQSSFDSCDGLWSSPAPLGQAPTSY